MIHMKFHYIRYLRFCCITVLKNLWTKSYFHSLSIPATVTKTEKLLQCKQSTKITFPPQKKKEKKKNYSEESWISHLKTDMYTIWIHHLATGHWDWTRDYTYQYKGLNMDTLRVSLPTKKSFTDAALLVLTCLCHRGSSGSGKTPTIGHLGSRAEPPLSPQWWRSEQER